MIVSLRQSYLHQNPYFLIRDPAPSANIAETSLGTAAPSGCLVCAGAPTLFDPNGRPVAGQNTIQ